MGIVLNALYVVGVALLIVLLGTLLLGPVIVSAAWYFGYIGFELTVVLLLVFIAYLSS